MSPWTRWSPIPALVVSILVGACVVEPTTPSTEPGSTKAESFAEGATADHDRANVATPCGEDLLGRLQSAVKLPGCEGLDYEPLLPHRSEAEYRYLPVDLGPVDADAEIDAALILRRAFPEFTASLSDGDIREDYLVDRTNGSNAEGGQRLQRFFEYEARDIAYDEGVQSRPEERAAYARMWALFDEALRDSVHFRFDLDRSGLHVLLVGRSRCDELMGYRTFAALTGGY